MKNYTFWSSCTHVLSCTLLSLSFLSLVRLWHDDDDDEEDNLLLVECFIDVECFIVRVSFDGAILASDSGSRSRGVGLLMYSTDTRGQLFARRERRLLRGLLCGLPCGLLSGLLALPLALPLAPPLAPPLALPIGMPFRLPAGLPFRLPAGLPFRLPAGLPFRLVGGVPQTNESEMLRVSNLEIDYFH